MCQTATSPTNPACLLWVDLSLITPHLILAECRQLAAFCHSIGATNIFRTSALVQKTWPDPDRNHRRPAKSGTDPSDPGKAACRDTGPQHCPIAGNRYILQFPSWHALPSRLNRLVNQRVMQQGCPSIPVSAGTRARCPDLANGAYL